MNAIPVVITLAAVFPLGKLRARVWTLVGFLCASLATCNGIAVLQCVAGFIPFQQPYPEPPGQPVSKERSGQFQLSFNRFDEAKSGCFLPIDPWGEEARV